MSGLPSIRVMTPDDVAPAARAVREGDWGDRTLFFDWASRHPEAHPFVADAGGSIVGTAVGTANGPAGWVGAVFVAATHRGQGLGRALTDAVVGAIERAGCGTLVLVATEAGRPMYERMGFRLDTTYHTIEAKGTDGGAAAAASLRPFRTADLAAMSVLDRAATGEDRAHLLAAFATPGSAKVLESRGTVRGFVVRAPWGGGATIAPDPDDAVWILATRRAAAGPDRMVRAGILRENLGIMDRLGTLGWSEAWHAPRLIRGDPLDWRPEAIWGQFNHALG